MSFEGLGALVEEVRRAREGIDQGDAKTHKRIDGIEHSINDLFRRVSRPGHETADDSTFERKSAIELCHIRRNLTVPKNDGSTASYAPAPAEIDEALIVRKALRNLFRHGDPMRLDPTERKSLTSFSFGINAFILAPEMSDTVLSCLVDPTDIAGVMNNVNISAPSIKFLIDNARMIDSAWACEASCFANNPQPDLQEGLGELEIKAETLRHIVCAGSDLIQDANFNIEQWVLQKVSQGFRNTLNNAIMVGDGLGKPMGILNPHAGIPICDVSPVTPPGMFTL
jgi:HK97 family phage major capsid protein